jgi:hypothetical protein
MIRDKVKLFVKNIWAIRNVFIIFIVFLAPLQLASGDSRVSK